MRTRGAGLLAAALLSPAPVAAKPKPLAITPASPDAAVILRVPRVDILYNIGIRSYDPAERRLAPGPTGPAWVNVIIRPGEPRDAFVVNKVKPGTYVFTDVIQQTRWATCFHKASYQFSIKPGQVLYLGEFDGVSALREVQRQAVARGHLSVSSYTFHNYFDDVPPPPLTPGDERSLAGARSFIAAEHPRTTSPVNRAQLSPAIFGTGRNPIGTKRMCSGWRSKKAEVPTAD
ncbi:MAG TPA: hypothetical protein VF688_06990 [Allosphingosinicella sp.]